MKDSEMLIVELILSLKEEDAKSTYKRKDRSLVDAWIQRGI
jgi:hypothetical protein